MDVLTRLVKSATPEVLACLVKTLAKGRLEIRRECLVFLEKHVSLDSESRAEFEGEVVLTLWNELESDLADLDEYGGGADYTHENVASLLYDICEKLKGGKASYDARRTIIGEVLEYIKSGNAGMDDQLYDVTYAACSDDDDLRALARGFEEMKRDWPDRHAREIYRKLGDDDKYLELRYRHMKYGDDYHDLATFFWKRGEKKRAVEVAGKGLTKSVGAKEQLRTFLSKRAREAGDRKGLLQLQFAQTVDCLTFEKYKNFESFCSKSEWRDLEDGLLKHLCKAWTEDRLKIHMHRKEYEEALALLKKSVPKIFRFFSNTHWAIARRLEKRFPQEILDYYLRFLGDVNRASPKKEYVRQAEVMEKLRHMYVDVLKAPDGWMKFARKVKADNQRRPAFQKIFAKLVPGWEEL